MDALTLAKETASNLRNRDDVAVARVIEEDPPTLRVTTQGGINYEVTFERVEEDGE